MIKIDETLGHTYIASFLNEDSVILDWGANKDNKFYEKHKCYVFAFEPLPSLFNELAENEKVKKFNYAIVSRSRMVDIFYSDVSCPSIYGDTVIKDGKRLLVEGKTYGDIMGDLKLKKVDLLKIDIEGEEVPVLEGFTSADVQPISQITVEFHDFLFPKLKKRVESIKNKFRGLGFYCIPFSMTNNGDILFVKDDKISFITYLYLYFFTRYIRGLARFSQRFLKRFLVFVT